MGKVAPVTPPSVSSKQHHEQAHATTMKGFPLVGNQGNVQAVATVYFSEL
jgi:hypothetical protein